MFELRILNGLHRGATLPLDNQSYVIGASEDADVVLVDAGIEEQHATLSCTDSGWILSALDGRICTAESNQAQTLIDLAAGDFVRVGSIWVTVVAQDAKWVAPPAEPVDTPFEAAGHDAVETPADTALAAEQFAAHTAAAEPAQHAEQPAAQTSKAARAGRGRRIMFVPLAMATVLSAAAAYAISAKPAPTMRDANLDIQGDIAAYTTGKQGTKDVAINAGSASGKKKAPLTQEELRSAFRKRLSEADLLKRFDLDLNDHSWTMQAALDDEETARFQRILTTFISTHKITFPVHAKVGNAEGMLPFKIRQVISGSNASVVTHEGNRLYVGDEYRGVRVAAIQGNRVIFTGKRKIEVVW